METVLSATGLVFDPEVPVWMLAVFAGLILALFAFGLWRGARGAWLRLLAGLALLAALADPRLSQEEREPLSDVALLLVDRSASQTIDGREALTTEARAALIAAAESFSDETPLDLRVVAVDSVASSAADDPGTRLFTAMESALADVGQDRIAGAVVITDGRAHDAPDFAAMEAEAIARRFPAPVHMLSTGREDSYDRRIVLESAPSFGIVGEDVSLRLRVEERGAIPAGAPMPVVTLSIDGRPVRRDILAVGEATTMSAPLDKGGASVFEVVVETLPGVKLPSGTTVRFSRSRARATACVCFSSRASPTRASGHGAICSRPTRPSIWCISPSCVRLPR